MHPSGTDRFALRPPSIRSCANRNKPSAMLRSDPWLVDRLQSCSTAALGVNLIKLRLQYCNVASLEERELLTIQPKPERLASFQVRNDLLQPYGVMTLIEVTDATAKFASPSLCAANFLLFSCILRGGLRQAQPGADIGLGKRDLRRGLQPGTPVRAGYAAGIEGDLIEALRGKRHADRGIPRAVDA